MSTGSRLGGGPASLAPLVAMTVVDGYADGEGELVARLLGIPLMRQRAPETAVGEALRYLAELPWKSQAIAANRELQWRQLDDESVEVATLVAGRKAAARLEFDGAGEIVRASCEARPRPVGKTFVATPWSGTFSDHRVLGQTRIPTFAEVSWQLPEGRFLYWRGRVNSLELVGVETSALLSVLLLELADFPMMRKMLLGVKARAETRCADRGHHPDAEARRRDDFKHPLHR